MKKIQNKLIELFNRYKHVWILSYFIIYLTWFGYLERTVIGQYGKTPSLLKNTKIS